MVLCCCLGSCLLCSKLYNLNRSLHWVKRFCVPATHRSFVQVLIEPLGGRRPSGRPNVRLTIDTVQNVDGRPECRTAWKPCNIIFKHTLDFRSRVLIDSIRVSFEIMSPDGGLPGLRLRSEPNYNPAKIKSGSPGCGREALGFVLQAFARACITCKLVSGTQ